tara:strand:+ start:1188 stop:1460 length:273 start_codon:yes stop_codon:yes gene_type:complete
VFEETKIYGSTGGSRDMKKKREPFIVDFLYLRRALRVSLFLQRYPIVNERFALSFFSQFCFRFRCWFSSTVFQEKRLFIAVQTKENERER